MGSISKVSLSCKHMKSQSMHDPHPSDFERFIPWVLRQFDIRNIFVKRINKAEYLPVVLIKKPKKQIKTVSVPNNSQELDIKDSDASTMPVSTELIPIDSLEDNVIISAYYDINGALVEIAFIDCIVPVPRELLMIIQLTFPHHPRLTRITWKGARLTSTLVYEISKIIPGSEITDLIFDGCYVPHGNYYQLLDKATQLKYLSLSHCKINDEVCVMIAERIQRNRPAAENLLVLNLSSNRITDVGAEALGHALKANRHLLYLNLCNNDITSVGAAHILTPLTKFKLSPDETMNMRLLKFNEIEKKIAEGFFKKEPEVMKEQKSKLKKKKDVDVSDKSDKSVIEDIYLASITEDKNGSYYCSGNFTLCSLNLAYNRVDSTTVSRILDVVAYQYSENKFSKTGLLRVVIEGNPLPETCMEYDCISKYIDLAIDQTTSALYGNLNKSLTKIKPSRSEQRSDTKSK